MVTVQNGKEQAAQQDGNSRISGFTAITLLVVWLYTGCRGVWTTVDTEVSLVLREDLSMRNRWAAR
ncbi:hypothetical protein N7456_008374 [Penicillium angulare]|uniref:Uncharacterized protein n=1 Tax=Penicillium angulare TaxID=116970 RepID=A0A9W9FCE8_9EURO|nr:hypothetical protein N7456_008374 [Penicillium angulare]